MTDREDLLIERLKSQIAIGERSSSKYVVYPPVSYEELEIAESRLGFALPVLFKRVYCEVGDGGFGPSYGLLDLLQKVILLLIQWSSGIWQCAR